MKNANRLYKRLRKIAWALALVAVLAAGLSMDAFTIISRADSAGKITANTAKVRKEASTSSDTLASVKKGDTVTIKGQTQAGDGYTWYQVIYDGTNTGYIRSDLMEVTDGTTPGTIVPSTTGQTTGSTSNTSASDETLVEVIQVQPVSAKVSGSSPVRVRQNASTTSRIVSTAQGGLALTVNGTASGTDGNEWYQVTFISNGAEVSGFVRADYVTLDGELVAADGAQQQEVSPQDAQPEKNEYSAVDTSKAWDTYYQDDIWHLVDNTSGKSYGIDQIFQTVETNNKTLKEVLATNKTQQIAVVALVILVVILVCVISVLVFKLKEMKDAAYYEKIERETARRRSAERTSQNGAKTGKGSGQRPAGQKPNGQRANGNGAKSQHPTGQKPAGQHANGGRNNGQHPAAQRPNGQRRPADAEETVQRQRPGEKQEAERRTVMPEQPLSEKQGESVREDAQEVTAAAMQENEVTVNEAVSTAQEAEQNVQEGFTENIEEAAKEIAREMGDPVPAASTEKPKWKSKNFVDDDEFEFQFLDWDEDQE